MEFGLSRALAAVLAVHAAGRWVKSPGWIGAPAGHVAPPRQAL